MNNKANWLEGRIYEIALVYHQVYGLNNITYTIAPTKVEFYSNGYIISVHKAMWK